MPPCSVVKRTLLCYDILPLAITASNALLHIYGYSGMHSHVGVENCCLNTHAASCWRLMVSHVWCQMRAVLDCQNLGNGDRLRMYGYLGMHSHVCVKNCCLNAHAASCWRLRVSDVWCQTRAALHVLELACMGRWPSHALGVNRLCSLLR